MEEKKQHKKNNQLTKEALIKEIKVLEKEYLLKLAREKKSKTFKSEKTFITSLINHLMRDGKKNWAHFVVMQIGTLIGKRLKKSPTFIFDRVFEILRPYIEVRKVRVRRTTYMVPFPTTEERQKHLVSFWILETVRKEKRKIDFYQKLLREIVLILLRRGETMEKKKEVYTRAEKSRSFLHYRWY
jgi:ribosomal protein S7